MKHRLTGCNSATASPYQRTLPIVGIEVKRKGLARNAIEDTLSLSEIANFASELFKKGIFVLCRRGKDVRDIGKALFYCNGTESAVIRRLHDEKRLGG